MDFNWSFRYEDNLLHISLNGVDVLTHASARGLPDSLPDTLRHIADVAGELDNLEVSYTRFYLKEIARKYHREH